MVRAIRTEADYRSALVRISPVPSPDVQIMWFPKFRDSKYRVCNRWRSRHPDHDQRRAAIAGKARQEDSHRLRQRCA
jgi:hypothetical protein